MWGFLGGDVQKIKRDGDLVEKTNLGRQILYSLDDMGKYKSICAKNRLLKRLNMDSPSH